MHFSAAEFPEEDYECLVEDCITWLADHRAYSTLNDTLCPISEEFICEKFANEKSNSTKIATMWQSNGYITVTNILRVVDSQKWQNCAIVYDIGTCKQRVSSCCCCCCSSSSSSSSSS